MYQIKIVSVGKTKEPWLIAALQEYEKRLSAHVKFSWTLVKEEKDLLPCIEKEPHFIALTLRSYEPTSEQFAQNLYFWLEKFGSRLTFVIGGSEGLSSSMEKQAVHCLSLSKMTFTHQMTRLLLLEQIYRAHEIAKGSNYHK